MAFITKQRHVFADGSRLVYCQGRNTTRFYFSDPDWKTDKLKSKWLPTSIAPTLPQCKRSHSVRDLYYLGILPREQ
jgi:hypothetical protein